MNDPSQEHESGERLDSWKEIAGYLSRGVRTVIRWEQEEGLPVRRLAHNKRGSVYAYKTELDAWRTSRGGDLEAGKGFGEAPRKLSTRRAWLAAAGAVPIVAGAWFLPRKFRTSGPPPRIVSLTAAPGVERMPTFSPDGRQVAYLSWSEGEESAGLCVKQVGPGAPVRLISGKRLGSPAFSPDGQHIAFRSTPPGVYVIPALGGPERKLFETRPGGLVGRLDGSVQFPLCRGIDWFPDGKRLIISEMIPERGAFWISEVVVGTGVRRELVRGYCPRVSPDGGTLGFTRMATGVHLMPAAGGADKPVIDERASDFAWMPDGREIIYCGHRDGFVTLWRAPVAGGTPRQVTEAGYDVGDPMVAPAGNRLAFTQWVRTQNLWRCDLNRPNAPGKLAATTRRQTDPQFSPDGKRLAFTSDRTGFREVWTCDSDGGNLRQLTSMGRMTVPPSSPRWSPDGREIAFCACPADRVEIYVLDAEGGSPRRVTSDSVSQWVPSYSRDGRFIYFADERERRGAMQVWKVPRSGGPARQLTRQGGFSSVESPDGRYLYYYRNREPFGICRLPASGGDENLILRRKVPELIVWWTVTERGLIYLDSDPTGWLVQLLDPETGATTEMARIAKDVESRMPQFTVSPDGHSIVYSRWDQASSNIMLIENFI